MLLIRNKFRLLKSELVASNTEAFFIEINLHEKKSKSYSISYSKSLIKNFTHIIGKILDYYIGNYDKVLVGGDFNSEISESSVHEFCSIYDLHNLCHNVTC